MCPTMLQHPCSVFVVDPFGSIGPQIAHEKKIRPQTTKRHCFFPLNSAKIQSERLSVQRYHDFEPGSSCLLCPNVPKQWTWVMSVCDRVKALWRESGASLAGQHLRVMTFLSWHVLGHGGCQCGHSCRKLCPFCQVAQKMLEIFRGAVALIDEIDWVRSLVYTHSVSLSHIISYMLNICYYIHTMIMLHSDNARWLFSLEVMHPLKSELHWPCGPVRPLDLAEATAPLQHWYSMGKAWKGLCSEDIFPAQQLLQLLFQNCSGNNTRVARAHTMGLTFADVLRDSIWRGHVCWIWPAGSSAHSFCRRSKWM